MSLIDFFLGKEEKRTSTVNNNAKTSVSISDQETIGSNSGDEKPDPPIPTFYANARIFPSRSLRRPKNVGKIYRGFKK